MPRTKAASRKPAHRRKHHVSLESTAYLKGLFDDFNRQVNLYKELTTKLLGLEARIELAEKTLCLTRDHVSIAIETTEGRTESTLPDWDEVSRTVRFVGMRLADACVALLEEHKKLTPQQLLDDLNEGTFRFRTNFPLREIHAALLRHPHVERQGQHLIWTGPKEQQMTMRLRVAERPSLVQPESDRELSEDQVRKA